MTEGQQWETQSALANGPGLVLSLAFQTLGGKFDYGVLRLVRASAKQRRAQAAPLQVPQPRAMPD